MTVEGAYIFLCAMKEDYSRWSKQAVDFFGLPGEYMTNAGAIWEEYVHPDDRAIYRRDINSIFAGDSTEHFIQYRAMAADGHYVICTCHGRVLFDENGEAEYFVGTIKNHSVLRTADPVTGLKNVYALFDDLERFRMARREQLILMVGIARFSEINDRYGYVVGNRVMLELSRILARMVSNMGFLYRMEGARLAFVTDKMTEQDIRQLLRNLRQRALQDISVDGMGVSVFLNAGLVIGDNFDVEPKTLFSCLWYAYYESRDVRQGDLVVFRAHSGDANHARIEKIGAVRESIADQCKGFFLVYQAIVNASTETIIGAEALLRYKDASLGIVLPSEFVGVLEPDPSFYTLGKWVLRQAMIEGKQFVERYSGFILNVNISYTHLGHASFLEDLESILRETGFPGANLCLEIYGKIQLLNEDRLKEMLLRLKSKGIKLALDRFGEEPRSLDFIQSIPVDVVKIHWNFMRALGGKAEHQEAVKHLAGIASLFGSEVCVVGMEDEDVRDSLRAYSVDGFQGQLYSKPVSAEELMQMEFRTEAEQEYTELTAIEKNTLKAKESNFVNASLEVQYPDRRLTYDDMLEKTRYVWSKLQNRDPSEINTINLYMKPAEKIVYYVVNGTDTGSFGI